MGFDPKSTCTTVNGEPVTLGEILESTGPATDNTPTGDTMPADDVRLANKVLQLNGLFDDEMMPGVTYAQVAERLADKLGIDLAA